MEKYWSIYLVSNNSMSTKILLLELEPMIALKKKKSYERLRFS